MCLLSFRRAVDGEEQRRPLIRPDAARLQIWLRAGDWLRAEEHLRDHGDHARVRSAELARTRQCRATLLHLAESRIVYSILSLPLPYLYTSYLPKTLPGICLPQLAKHVTLHLASALCPAPRSDW